MVLFNLGNKLDTNLVEIFTGPFPGFGMEPAKPDVWDSVDTRPHNRKVAEFQLLSWFRRVHHGRLLKAGFPVQSLTPNPDSDDEGLYD